MNLEIDPRLTHADGSPYDAVDIVTMIGQHMVQASQESEGAAITAVLPELLVMRAIELALALCRRYPEWALALGQQLDALLHLPTEVSCQLGQYCDRLVERYPLTFQAQPHSENHHDHE
jgi:hypothetical protein